MLFKTNLFLLVALFFFTDAAFVDNLTRCKINDGACQRKLVQSIISDGDKYGISEIGIHLDSIKLKDVSVSVLDLVDITLLQGQVKGVRACIVNKFETNIEERRAVVDITCDLIIKGQYKVFSENPMIKNLLGEDTIRGEGNGKVKIEKLHLRNEFHFDVLKKGGDIFFKCKPNENKYIYDIGGKMNFAADNLFVGRVDASQAVTDLLNQNGKFIMSTFGKPFFDKGMDIFYEYLHKFFENVPARFYITTDLDEYVDKVL